MARIPPKIGPTICSSKAVILATDAGTQVAMCAFKQEVPQSLCTLFACQASSCNFPPATLVNTFVAFSKLFRGFPDSLSMYKHIKRTGFAFDNYFCSSEEPIFVPLVTRTFFPRYRTNVAKFSMAQASTAVSLPVN